ncbi:MAG: ribosome maturation factor RimM [Gammaproteobacteria bacterium]|nr:ribosome maturation factor RimM [Gammaproteobacteria bacterium]
MSDDEAGSRIVVGRINGLYGVAGWMRVYSHTAPRAGILDYSPWYLEQAGTCRAYAVAEGRVHGKGIVVRLDGVADREQARALLGSDISVERRRLPALPEGEFYWVDLLGLEVVTVAGAVLGTVADFIETGANDVLVVRGERERLVPYLPDRVVTAVDRGAGRITVDWDPDF